jgi:hypothetical protein
VHLSFTRTSNAFSNIGAVSLKGINSLPKNGLLVVFYELNIYQLYCTPMPYIFRYRYPYSYLYMQCCRAGPGSKHHCLKYCMLFYTLLKLPILFMLEFRLILQNSNLIEEPNKCGSGSKTQIRNNFFGICNP